MGLVVFLASLSSITVKTIARSRGTSRPQELFSFVFLLFLVLTNLTESVLLRQNTLFWALYVSIVLSWPAGVVSRR